MCDASELAAGYLFLLEDYSEPNSGCLKTYTLVAFVSKKFQAGQMSLLRLFIGVVLEAVAVVLFLIGVEVTFSGMLSGSESDSSADLIAGCF